MNQQSPVDKITDFINRNGKFPESADLSTMGISLDDAIKYVVENQNLIRSQGLLSEEVIQQAINRYN